MREKKVADLTQKLRSMVRPSVSHLHEDGVRVCEGVRAVSHLTKILKLKILTVKKRNYETKGDFASFGTNCRGERKEKRWMKKRQQGKK